MNSNVHPLLVVLVLLLTGVAIGIWVWGTGEAGKIGGPAELRTDRDGHLYIQIQNKLVEHDAEGVFLKTHDLAKLGVEQVLGSFALFANGDVLLRRGPDPRSFGGNVRAYQRKTNAQSLEPDSPDAGLYRCNLETITCTRFGPDGIDFKAAHGIYIDWRTDEVYVTDTTRHLLRKYSASGVALAAPVGGFKFPNQLMMVNEELFIADTNHHRIQIVDPRTTSFGDNIESKEVIPNEASDAGRDWPSHFARVGNSWWVNNMRTGMNEGGLYVFDDDWHYEYKVDLPPGADPISLIEFGNEVLVTDWNNDRIHRVSTTGEHLSDFESAGFQTVLENSRVARSKFEVVSYSGIGLFVLVIGGLMVRALAVSMSVEPE